MLFKKKKEKCKYTFGDYKCSRDILPGDEHCIFHSKDIEMKMDRFNDEFKKEIEWQKKHDRPYNFEGFIFPYGYFLERATLQGAYLQGADLQGAKLELANLQGANLQGAKLELANLQGANLQGADLQGAKLRAELKEANLQEAKLGGAKLGGANLVRTNLKKANLRGADLSGSNLYETDLRRADLRNANFENCNVSKIKYNRWGRYQGIRLTNCYGSPRFVRFAKDQEYLEELRSSKFRFYTIYLPWLILADCGRSFLIWASWALAMAFLFAWKFFSMGPGAFTITNLKYSFETMVY